MFKDVYKLIKEFDKIVIARHIGVDPDALAASCALKNSILLTFPSKSVKVVGASSSRFSYFGKMDKYDVIYGYFQEVVLCFICFLLTALRKQRHL